MLTILQILKGDRAKNLEATLLFVDFYKAFDSIRSEKIKQILVANGLPRETIAALMVLYKNTKVKARTPNGDTDYLALSQVCCKGTH